MSSKTSPSDKSELVMSDEVESALVIEHNTPCVVKESGIASMDRGLSLTSSTATSASMYSCIFCDKTYKTKQSVKRHIRQTHGFQTVNDDHYTTSGSC